MADQLTAYQTACATACSGCAAGLKREIYAGDKVFRPFTVGEYCHIEPNWGKPAYSRCAAPTLAEFAEQQHERAEKAERERNDIKRTLEYLRASLRDEIEEMERHA